jgi:hypothetical protein
MSMHDTPPPAGRRSFLKLAGALAVSTATACQFETRIPAVSSPTNGDRNTNFDRALLDAVGTAVLPSELGNTGVAAAVAAFVVWADGYDPVAEEMHGYGYSDIRYLPADPAPAWRAQLTALDLLARRSLRKSFVELTVGQRRAMIANAVQGVPGDRLPSPIDASHVALALLSHWASSPDAWDLALGVKVQGGSCRVLGDANAKPVPMTGRRA